jgi:urease accessory protein
LEGWIAATITHGSGRVDADILRDAWRAAVAGDDVALAEAGARGIAYRATTELALESSQQGAAFLAALRAAWSDPPIAARSATGEGVCHATVFGAAAAGAGVALSDALLAYLHAFATNLMSAGLRLGIVGQNDGQRILAALEPMIEASVEASLMRSPEDFGAAPFALDLASMAHETQYTRLFRS